MNDLLDRMKLTLRSGMGDTLVINHQFVEAIEYIQQLEKLLEKTESDEYRGG